MSCRHWRFWKEKLGKECRLADVRWVRTDDTCTPFRHGREMFEQIVKKADVVINGVAL